MKDFLYILLLAILVFCWSCSGDTEDVPTPIPKPEEKPKVEVTTAAPVLSQEGGNSTVTFTSTDSWTIDVSEGSSVSWCSVTPTSGGKGTHTLTIQTTANETYDERNAKVSIKVGAIMQSFMITQKQKDAIMVAKNEYTMEAAGGELKLEVNSNVNFKVETSVGWIKQNTGSRGLEVKSLSFTIEENASDASREGMITITSGELKQEIKVIQKQKDVIMVAKNEYTMEAAGGELKLEVNSNVNFKVGTSVGWIKQKTGSRGLEAKSLCFTIEENASDASREGMITITSGELKQEIKVIQKGAFNKGTIGELESGGGIEEG